MYVGKLASLVFLFGFSTTDYMYCKGLFIGLSLLFAFIFSFLFMAANSVIEFSLFFFLI